MILIAVCAGLLLDPGVYSYYTSGALLGTVLIALAITRWRIPWLTLAGAAMLYATRFTGDLIPFTMRDLGLLRAVFVITAPLLVLLLPDGSLVPPAGRHARGQTRQERGLSPVPLPQASRHPSMSGR